MDSGTSGVDTLANMSSPVLEVIAGDYFELFIKGVTKTAANATWFSMEIVS